MFDKFKRRLSGMDTPESDELTFKSWGEHERREASAPEETVEVAPEKVATDKSGNVELKVIRPESYDEVGSVADYLLEGCTVVLNVEALDRPTVLRMLDFLNGVTYCSDGEIKKVATSTFIITPHSNVDISDM